MATEQYGIAMDRMALICARLCRDRCSDLAVVPTTETTSF
jgi:hypothetical protein